MPSENDGVNAEGPQSGEVRVQITGTGEGTPSISIYDCFESAPMKEDYGVSSGAKLIVQVENGQLEVIDGE